MKNIAIIGTGIAGLTSAYLLSKKHRVTVFEKNSYIGGHTATVDVCVDNRNYAIDTGFIVFNNKTYPNFLALLAEIGIGKQKTEMSFSVRNCQSGLEYNGHNLNTLFAQRLNIFKPKFWSLITEIVRFNNCCKAVYEKKDYQQADTLGEFLKDKQFSDFFAEHYILPMGAAIWSTSLQQMQAFEFKFFVQFFHHHGLLDIKGRPQWYVIPGGSRSYIKPLCQPFQDNINLNSQISFITRKNQRVQIYFQDQSIQEFDEIVLACHSDQSLSLLSDATNDEKEVLSALPYSKNSVILHTDVDLLPQNRRAWASWNYQLKEQRDKPASVTYNMNILQGIESDTVFCVTLNQELDINPSKILRKFTYSHPVFSSDSSKAQAKRSLICGQQHTHFAGAYWHNGFHEDGVKSAIEVAERFHCYLQADEMD